MKTLPFIALILLSQTAPAFAQPVASPVTQVVRVADLDLSSGADRTRLGHRIRHAVNLVCGEASVIDRVGQKLAQHCREEIRLSVQAQQEAAIAGAQHRAVIASAN